MSLSRDLPWAQEGHIKSKARDGMLLVPLNGIEFLLRFFLFIVKMPADDHIPGTKVTDIHTVTREVGIHLWDSVDYEG